MPRCFAHARIAAPRSRSAAERPAGRRGPRPARRACSTNGASCLRNAAAFFLFKSISCSAPPTANRTVSTAGPPSRSSSQRDRYPRRHPEPQLTPPACTLLIKSAARSHPDAASPGRRPAQRAPRGMTGRVGAPGRRMFMQACRSDRRSKRDRRAAGLRGPACRAHEYPPGLIGCNCLNINARAARGLDVLGAIRSGVNLRVPGRWCGGAARRAGGRWGR